MFVHLFSVLFKRLKIGMNIFIQYRLKIEFKPKETDRSHLYLVLLPHYIVLLQIFWHPINSDFSYTRICNNIFNIVHIIRINIILHELLFYIRIQLEMIEQLTDKFILKCLNITESMEGVHVQDGTRAHGRARTLLYSVLNFTCARC